MLKAAHLIILLVCYLPMTLHANWQQEIALHHFSPRNSFDAIILAQYKAYKSGKLPKIADPVIQVIPIQENGEEMIDIAAQDNPRIQMLPSPKHAFASPDHHAGLLNATKVRKSVYKKLNDMVSMLDLMAPQYGYSPEQINIMIFEGLRDIKTQEKLFNDKMNEIKNDNPSMTEEELFAETAKWVSPVKNNIPVHATGAAVDLRLYDTKKKDFVDLGKFGVLWGPNPEAPTFYDKLTNAQISNRLFLLISASRAGLINYPYEYWHFSSGDRYAAYWLLSNNKQSDYGIYTETK